MEAELDINAVVATPDGDPLNIKDTKEVCVSEKVYVEKIEKDKHEEKQQEDKNISKEEDGMIV